MDPASASGHVKTRHREAYYPSVPAASRPGSMLRRLLRAGANPYDPLVTASHAGAGPSRSSVDLGDRKRPQPQGQKPPGSLPVGAVHEGSSVLLGSGVGPALVPHGGQRAKPAATTQSVPTRAGAVVYTLRPPRPRLDCDWRPSYPHSEEPPGSRGPVVPPACVRACGRACVRVCAGVCADP